MKMFALVALLACSPPPPVPSSLPTPTVPPRVVTGPSCAGAVLLTPDAGQLAFSDLCPLGADRSGVLEIAKSHGVAIPAILARLATDGCRSTDAPFTTTAPLIRVLTAGVLEEKLRCDPAATGALSQLRGGTAITLVENLRR
jgi:hypothetical protein